jgi:hypothetical protein
MKIILNVRLTSTFRVLANNYAANNNADVTIEEYFRDLFVYRFFKTFRIEQNSITGVYTLTVQPSKLDTAPLTTLVDDFCLSMFDHGVVVEGYTPPTFEDSETATATLESIEKVLCDGALIDWCNETDQNLTTDFSCLGLLLSARSSLQALRINLQNAN